ncbi:MFS transporter [Clostridia bacterium]|nr:MFS transporter [Clostridia bacterium]
MDSNTIRAIRHDRQIRKFSLYGFLKNLKFFEPYLVIFLFAGGLNFFQIGLLYAIKEIIIYIFEIPSGVMADNYGRKKELYLCFTFYIISFVIFFFTQSFFTAALAMVFFGLGEAFRSGTHKAMMYTYLEEKNWEEHKMLVYGRTRSFSLIGSAISSILAVALILNIPGSRYIFLASIVPYILDLLLIMSYPESLDRSGVTCSEPFMQALVSHMVRIFKRPKLRRFLVKAATFEAVFKSVKDYIQPILGMLLMSSGLALLSEFSLDDQLKIVLGITYGVINLFSAFASRNVYRLQSYMVAEKMVNLFYLAQIICFFILYWTIRISQPYLIALMFVALYLIRDMRKPVLIDICGSLMKKEERATVLSVESQMRALFTVVLAPAAGFIADKAGVGLAMLCIGLLLLLVYFFVPNSVEDPCDGNNGLTREQH